VGKQVTPANLATEDSFSPDSYWWLFRHLNDWVKGDSVNSLPGCYVDRNPQVRSRFNALEQSFSEQLPEVMKRAARIREQNPIQMAAILDEFSETCIHQVLETIEYFIG
jgi:secernin